MLVEFGPPVLDLELRFRVHALMQALEAKRLTSVIDLTPGIRSLQIHYDSRALSQSKALALVLETHASLPSLEDLEVPSRIVHLPCRGTIPRHGWRSRSTCNPCERMRPGARATSSSSVASTVSTASRT